MPSDEYTALGEAWMRQERARAGLPPAEETGSPQALQDHIKMAAKVQRGSK